MIVAEKITLFPPGNHFLSVALACIGWNESIIRLGPISNLTMTEISVTSQIRYLLEDTMISIDKNDELVDAMSRLFDEYQKYYESKPLMEGASSKRKDKQARKNITSSQVNPSRYRETLDDDDLLWDEEDSDEDEEDDENNGDLYHASKLKAQVIPIPQPPPYRPTAKAPAMEIKAPTMATTTMKKEENSKSLSKSASKSKSKSKPPRKLEAILNALEEGGMRDIDLDELDLDDEDMQELLTILAITSLEASMQATTLSARSSSSPFKVHAHAPVKIVHKKRQATKKK